MKTLPLAHRTISTDRAAFVMGIVNATPDSFYAPSRTKDVDAALRLIDEGADILDIGGESTRPGSAYVSEEEELRRVIPLIKEIRRANSAVAISVDTRKGNVMRAALEEGADILNDISALEDDASLFQLCAETQIPVILMHKAGVPQTMQAKPLSGDIFDEVNRYLLSRAELAEKAGIAAEKIIVDPGIGFGKTHEANKSLIARCGELCGGRYQVLMALSRKTVIGEMLAKKASPDAPLLPLPPEERLYGTLTADILSVLSGASIIRVHDVKPAADTMTVLAKMGYNSHRECV